MNVPPRMMTRVSSEREETLGLRARKKMIRTEYFYRYTLSHLYERRCGPTEMLTGGICDVRIRTQREERKTRGM